MEWLRNLMTLQAKDVLALTVLGAMITATATIVSTVIKDYFFARSLETWRRRREARDIYARYRDPIVLAAIELLSRCREVLFEAEVSFLTTDVVNSRPARFTRNEASDPYFLRYKFVSTLYRFMAFFAWLELYRREVTFLDSGRSRINRRLDSAIEWIRTLRSNGFGATSPMAT